MAELLLRGAQTVGELRGRAARMEPIKDLSELTPTLDSLHAKGLVLYLTPPGRGSVVTHALYLDRELEKVRREAGAVQSASTMRAPPQQETSDTLPSAAMSLADAPDVTAFSEEVNSLRNELAALRHEFEAARHEFAATADALRRDFDQLNQQLGN